MTAAPPPRAPAIAPDAGRARPVRGGPGALVAAAHPGPTLVVTVLIGAVGLAIGLAPGTLALVSAAVLTGQLSIGWSNDLVDAARDRLVARRDKPLATGLLSPRAVAAACAVALALCSPLSFLCGPVAGLVHLVCVGAGWAYNLGLKATVWSWAPYAVAFGALPAFAWLAGRPDQLPPWWLVVAGACLGVGAHLLNVLPDLADDAATGVRGLPHRLGVRRLPAAAVATLGLGTLATLAGAGSRTTLTAPAVAAVAATLLTVPALSAIVLRGRGKAPFVAAVGIALVNVALLLVVL